MIFIHAMGMFSQCFSVSGYMSDFGVYLRCSAFLLFAITLPIFTIAAVIFNRWGSKERIDSIVGRFGLKRTGYYISYEVTPKRDGYLHYLVQIIVICFVCLYFGSVLLFSDEALATIDTLRFIVLGPTDRFRLEPDELYEIQARTLHLMGFAYLGWLIWSLTTVFSRFRTLEVLPSTYSTLIIRFVVSVTIVPIVASLLISSINNLATISLVSAVSFLVGMFPEIGLAYIRQIAEAKLVLRRDAHGEIKPARINLSLIEGVTYARKLRLAEIGIEDVQGLAFTNPFRILGLSAQSPFEVVDWIAQAQLLLEMKPANFEKLRGIGIRNVLHFVQQTDDPAELSSLAEASNLLEVYVRTARTTFLADASFHNLYEFSQRLAVAEPDPEWARRRLPWLESARHQDARRQTGGHRGTAEDGHGVNGDGADRCRAIAGHRSSQLADQVHQ